MSVKKIVFPTDFSTASDVAMRYASTLAAEMGAKLLIVHVEEPPMAYGGGELYYGMPEPDQEAMMAMLKELKPADPSVPCDHHLLAGEPASEITAFADKEKADMIVMGTHGRTGLRRLLMGSVAEAVVRHANCPVFTLKCPHTTQAANG